VNHPPLQVQASLQNRITARLFPEWTLRYKSQHFLRSPYAKIIAVEELGLSPPDPWLLNSGFADAIAVESAAMSEYYLAAGIPDNQLVETGSLADDMIVTVQAEVPKRRHSLLQEFGLQDDGPLLLCAPPPDQNTFDRPGCEFRNFDDLVGFWSECLGSIHGWNVIVRPHPKTSPDRLDALRQNNLNISYADTATLVPLCDLYVAAVSATIRWAIACGKPVINFDVYQYGYQDYKGVEGVILANKRDEFRALLERITHDDEYRIALTDLQRKVSGRWGRLDGACGRRMLALLHGEAMAENEPAIVTSGDLSKAIIPGPVSPSADRCSV
jgi:hypothetical protein